MFSRIPVEVVLTDVLNALITRFENLDCPNTAREIKAALKMFRVEMKMKENDEDG